MNNLEILKKFADQKEVADLIDEITTLHKYFCSKDYKRMQVYIQKLMIKYYEETICWNSVNKQQPQNFAQAFYNAERFLLFKGIRIIAKSVNNYKQRLTKEELRTFEMLMKM
jgi:hypothetical protein